MVIILSKTKAAIFCLREYMTVPVGNPELLRAQINALSRTIPLFYFILIVNVWALAIGFIGKAPNWLSVYTPLAISSICAIRLVQWWRKRHAHLPHERAVRELQRTNKIAAVLGVACPWWSITLFPYGDIYAQAYVGTFMMMSMICSMICLIHSRPAVIIIAITVSVPLVSFFVSTGEQAFLGSAINALLVSVAVTAVILTQYRDFTRMIDARKQAEHLGSENLRLANLDSLTALPNRRAFFMHLDEAFAAACASGTRLAVGMIDLDGFKPINDLHGHATGDSLLVEVAARLIQICSPKNIFMSRLGGDEFAFVVSSAPDDLALLALGEEIAEHLRLAFSLPQATVQVAGSVGIAVYPEMALSSEQLFERADYALYHSKRSRRGGAILFSAEHDRQINQDARIDQALKCADIEQELSVAFQPVVDIRSHKTIGFEALARWTSPSLGCVPPGQFIPVAERSGIVGMLTRPLLRKALAATAQWPEEIRLSFNLSVCDLSTAESALAILSIIERSGFDPRRLDLEITETAFEHDFEQVQRSVEMLKLLGCGFSLDDFGTGYSSLSRLHALPLTKIKIDRSFVAGLHNSLASRKIVKSLLALSRDMGLDCVVEGVETQEELAALRSLGGTMVQGYYYSPPIIESQILAYLDDAGHLHEKSASPIGTIGNVVG